MKHNKSTLNVTRPASLHNRSRTGATYLRNGEDLTFIALSGKENVKMDVVQIFACLRAVSATTLMLMAPVILSSF